MLVLPDRMKPTSPVPTEVAPARNEFANGFKDSASLVHLDDVKWITTPSPAAYPMPSVRNNT